MTTSVKSLVPLVEPVYKKIVSHFPQNYIKFSFAYGSAVFPQGGIKLQEKPMIDMIFVVDESENFHNQNLRMNPGHYSFLRYFGHEFITIVQEKWPAKVYFNTLIPFEKEGIMFKYGVVNQEDLINDLYDWNYLYLSGRLHKPVKFVEPPVGPVTTALKQNLMSAIHAALIMLPENFTLMEFFLEIADLSYNGDFRMIYGEDKNKVINIVEKQIPEFCKLYGPLLGTLHDVVEIPDKEAPDKLCTQDTSPRNRMYHLFQLPKIPQKALIKHWQFHVSWRRKDSEDVLKNMACDPDIGQILSNCLKMVVLKSSIEQSLKGLFTAGFKKSLQYSNKKITRMVKAREQN
ncbi:phosphatidate cytidylyltransferase, mitochondrial isoform X1 [Rhodnius prolixus]|uniref:Phosphatidate cytidylyltransferase, mitochondrial n=1 Tax=Rhodnius neglectus TaxID=72488 RepID=A0A0N7Z8Q1_9HEMI